MITSESGNRTILRGDIFTYNFGQNNGSVQNGVRPAVVIQINTLNRTSTTTIIAPITTSLKRITMPSHIYIGKKFGLNNESMILLEQVRVVNQNELAEYIGTINDDEILNSIDEGVKSLFGIISTRNVKSGTKILCNKCFGILSTRNDSIIKRVDSFEQKVYRCERCGNAANRYFVVSNHREIN